MSQIRLETYEGQTRFGPGAAIDGLVSWQFARPPDAIEVHLVWATGGKGDTDCGLAVAKRFERPEAENVQPFSFTAPPGPYSFSGRLITLGWALEAVVKGDKRAVHRLPIVIAPGREEVRI